MPAIHANKTRPRKQPKKAANPFVKRQQDLYLAALKKNSLMYLAAEAAGTTYNIVLTYRNKHPEFKEKEDAAIKMYQESLVEEAVRRGREGVEQDVYGTLEGKENGTGVVGKRRVYSDKLLEVMLKRDDAKYREATQFKKVDQSTKHSGMVGTAAIDTSKLNREEKKQLLVLLEKAAPAVVEEK